jgi:Uma2 family endonuclease
LYEEFGLPEYWVVFPGEKEIKVYTLRNNKFTELQIYIKGEEAISAIFPGLRVLLAECLRISIE